jgi:hypothetical protein
VTAISAERPNTRTALLTASPAKQSNGPRTLELDEPAHDDVDDLLDGAGIRRGCGSVMLRPSHARLRG